MGIGKLDEPACRVGATVIRAQVARSSRQLACPLQVFRGYLDAGRELEPKPSHRDFGKATCGVGGVCGAGSTDERAVCSLGGGVALRSFAEPRRTLDFGWFPTRQLFAILRSQAELTRAG